MNSNNLTVLFDGGCPLCSREIAHYRKLKALKSIDWLDVTREDLSAHGISVKPRDAMEEFHVIDESGCIHKGADGFVVLWRALPHYRWLAKLCAGLRLLPLMRVLYARFARWHFRRRCETGICG